MNRVVDALIVGAGVAGASAALRLARRGLSVLLVDRAALPRHKVCGCCLNREAVEQLGALGLGTELGRAGAVPIRRVVAGSRGYAAGFSTGGGLAISRHALDGLLVQHAQRAGCEVLDKTSARVCALPERRGVPVRLVCSGRGVDNSNQVEARVVIIADGLSGSSLSDVQQGGRSIRPGSLRGYGAVLGPDTHGLKPGEIVMRCGAAGYVGTVVLEDGSLDIAAAMKPSWVKQHGGPAPAAEAIAQEAGLPLDGLDSTRWHATAPLTGRRQLSLPGVLVIGDAAGYVEPFTGEGMSWALRSARAALPIALDIVRDGWSPRDAQRWRGAYRQAVGCRQWRCRLSAQVLRRPRLTAMIFAGARCLPEHLRSVTAKIALPPMFQSTTPGNPLREQPTCQ